MHEGDMFEFINSFANTEQNRFDSIVLVKLMKKVTMESPRMRVPPIIGFCNYHYKSKCSKIDYNR